MEENKPVHIAIIPDGNRRWGELHKISREEAYAIGIDKIQDVLTWCREFDIKMISFWGFSMDNFKRDSSEVGKLFELFKRNLKRVLDSEQRKKYDVRVKFFGRLHLFPREIQEMMKKGEEISAKNKSYQLNLFLGYGGREEVVDAINGVIKEGIKEVNEKIISEHLYTKEIPDPDLVIRTSGEQRLSGLMPWQTCYSEFYFSKKLWPDFTKEDFKAAIDEFARRKRRYGK